MAEGEGGGGIHVPEGAKTKVLGLPLWVVVGAGAGILAVLIYLRSRNATSPGVTTDPAATVTDTGVTPSGSSDFSNSQSDPLTIAQLTAAMQTLQANIMNQKPSIVVNVPAQTPRGGAGPFTTEVINNISLSTTRTTGGKSTSTTASGPTQFKPTTVSSIVGRTVARGIAPGHV